MTSDGGGEIIALKSILRGARLARYVDAGTPTEIGAGLWSVALRFLVGLLVRLRRVVRATNVERLRKGSA